jgi:hypothetical protein
MATTTPNYGWTVPTSTDLVKDGATAIETLGDAIDASMNTALGTKKAMGVLLTTVSFSAVASQAINSVFSATYENYQIVLKVVGSTGPIGLNLRMRVAGVSASGSDYRFGNHFVTGGGVEGVESSSNSATSASLGSSMYTASYFSNQRIEIFQPFLTERTTGVLQSVHPRDSNGFLNATCYGGFFHNLATSYDGFELLTSTGTMTGNVSVYGYNK